MTNTTRPDGVEQALVLAVKQLEVMRLYAKLPEHEEVIYQGVLDKIVAAIAALAAQHPSQSALKLAYDALRFYVDASEEELKERGLTRDTALRLARDAEVALLKEAEQHPGQSAGEPVADERARAVLAELVAVKDLKERTEALYFAGPTSEHGEGWKDVYEAQRKEYLRRQPAAWAEARAALAASPPPTDAAKPIGYINTANLEHRRWMSSERNNYYNTPVYLGPPMPSLSQGGAK